ncbi:site-specific integrase [Pseudorhodoferax soli]|uniref:Phage integrase family protein n=1 Tax=Pseudorhodoferax soli TaxID=545864 RepID=A0A368XR92_9BURK|nr:site-specific integrase [Pseudorhodoferax soli]RCW69548.1 phage integrase family protein [Pseudorhodoferax soli]
MDAERFALSTALLRSVLSGMTYDAAARVHGLSRTAVERRVKALVLELVRSVGIDGLNESRAMFVRQLRAHREGIERALVRFEPHIDSAPPSENLILSDDDIRTAVRRVKARTRTPERDVAMVWILLATGLPPLEVARLEVSDYLNADGTVRLASTVRASVAVNGRSRPLYFSSPAACEAIDAYLATRARPGPSIPGSDACFRGLDPQGALFLTQAGNPFHVASVPSGSRAQALCREVHYAYRKIFRRIGIPGLSALSLRQTVVDRLLRKGAEIGQIGELLGVRDLRVPSRKRVNLPDLMHGLV